MVALAVWRAPPRFGPALAAWDDALAGVTGVAGWPAEWAGAAWALFALAWLSVALHAAGARVTRWLRARRAVVAAPRITALLAGWAVAGTTLAGLAACGLFRTAPLLGLALVPAVAAIMRARVASRRAAGRDGIPGRRDPRHPAAGVLPIGGRLARWTAVAAVVVLGTAALPLTDDPDSLMQHLVVADRALAYGNFTALPGNLVYHLWAPNELLRGWMLLVGGEAAACLPSVLAHALAAGLLVGIVGQVSGAGWGWCAAAAWMTHSITAGSAMTAKPDAWLAPLGLAGAVAALRAGAGGAGLAIGGLLLGAAVAAKPVAAPYAVAAGLLAALAPGLRWRRLALYGAAAAVPVVPWALKTWLFTGDPAYPLGYPVWKGVGMTPWLHELHVTYVANVTHAVIVEGWAARLAAPWTFVMSGGISPLFLALLPLAWTAAPVRTLGWRWPAAVIASLAVWFTGPIQFRYLLAALPVWVAAGTVGLAGAGVTGRVIAVAAVASSGAALLARPGIADRLPSGLGFESRAAYRRRMLNVRAESLEAIERLPAGAVVAVIGSSYGVPAPRRLLPHNFTEPPFFYSALRASASPGELSRRLRQGRVTHVLYNPPGAVYHRRRQAAWPVFVRDVTVWSAWWRAHAREVFRSSRADPQGGFEVLYALTERPAGPASVAWLPGVEGLYGYFEQVFNGEGFDGGMARLESVLPALGEFGPVLHLQGSVWANRDADRALALFRRADATGMRDVIFAEEWRDVAVRAGDRAARDLANRRIAELTGAPPPGR